VSVTPAPGGTRKVLRPTAAASDTVNPAVQLASSCRWPAPRPAANNTVTSATIHTISRESDSPWPAVLRVVRRPSTTPPDRR